MSHSEQEQLLSEISQVIEQYKTEVTGARKMWPRAVKDRVRQLRETGISAMDLAGRVGVPYATVKSWESGRKLPRGHFKRVKMAEASPEKSLTVKSLTVKRHPEPHILRVSTARGLTVEGLNFEQVVSLLKAVL